MGMTVWRVSYLAAGAEVGRALHPHVLYIVDSTQLFYCPHPFQQYQVPCLPLLR